MPIWFFRSKCHMFNWTHRCTCTLMIYTYKLSASLDRPRHRYYDLFMWFLFQFHHSILFIHFFPLWFFFPSVHRYNIDYEKVYQINSWSLPSHFYSETSNRSSYMIESFIEHSINFISPKDSNNCCCVVPNQHIMVELNKKHALKRQTIKTLYNFKSNVIIVATVYSWTIM